MYFFSIVFAIVFENDAFQLYFSCLNRCDIFLNQISEVLDDYSELLQIRSKIVVDVKMTSLDIIEATGSRILGFAKPSQFIYMNSSIGSYLFPKSLAKQFLPSSNDSSSDIYAELIDLKGRWSFEDGIHDFKVVVAHELAHGLGMISSLVTTGGISPDLSYESIPSKEQSVIFSQPTVYDHFIKCGNDDLTSFIKDYSSICAKYSTSVFRDTLKSVALEYVDGYSRKMLKKYLSTPSSCKFTSKLTSFYIYTAKDVTYLNDNLVSHSLAVNDSNPISMMNSETTKNKYNGVKSIMPILFSMGYASKTTASSVYVHGVENISCSKLINVEAAKLEMPKVRKNRVQWIVVTAIYVATMSYLQFVSHLTYTEYYLFLHNRLYFLDRFG